MNNIINSFVLTNGEIIPFSGDGIQNIYGNSYIIKSGENANFKWEISNQIASGIYLSGSGDALPFQTGLGITGEYSTGISSSKTYFLGAELSGSGYTEYLSIFLAPTGIINYFTGQTGLILSSSSSNLNWGIQNYENIFISVKESGQSQNIFEGFDLTGSVLINPLESSTYTLEAKLSGISYYENFSISVAPKFVLNFEKNNIKVSKNSPVSLNWNVDNADSIYLSGIGSNISYAITGQTGYTGINPSETITYSLIASKSGLLDSGIALITVEDDFELYEFPPTFVVDTGNLSAVYTGSGVHLNKDVRFNFNFIDSLSKSVLTDYELATNPIINSLNFDILDKNGNLVVPNYKTNSLNTSLIITERENIQIFKQYTKDFGVRLSVTNNINNELFVGEFYVYGNLPKIKNIQVYDGSQVIDPNLKITYEPNYNGDHLTKTTLILPYIEDSISNIKIDGQIFENTSTSGGKNLYEDGSGNYVGWNSGSLIWQAISGAFTGYSSQNTDYPWQVTGWTSGWWTSLTKEIEGNYFSVGYGIASKDKYLTLERNNNKETVYVNLDLALSDQVLSFGSINNKAKLVTYNYLNSGYTGSGVNYFVSKNNVISSETIIIPNTASGEEYLIKEYILDANDLIYNSGQINDKIKFDLFFENNLQYLKIKSYDIYKSERNDIVINDYDAFAPDTNSRYLYSIEPQLQQELNSIEINNLAIESDTPYFFAIVPKSELGTGEVIYSGPHILKDSTPIENVIASTVSPLGLSFGDQTVQSKIDNLYGDILSNGQEIIDIVQRGSFNLYKYTAQIIDSFGNVMTSELKITDSNSFTGQSAYFTEYGISENSYLTYSIEAESNNIVLYVSGVNSPATYKLYKLSM